MNRIKHEIDEILEKDHFCLKDMICTRFSGHW